MQIYGIDFTSHPTRRKPITCLECRLHGGVLSAGALESLTSFGAFEAMLQRPGPWIAGIYTTKTIYTTNGDDEPASLWV